MLNFLEDLTRHGLVCMLIASIGAVLYGFDNGWWGTALGSQKFLRDFGNCKIINGKETCQLTTTYLSAGSAVQSAGIMVGCFTSAFINHLLGRRMSLVIAAIISIIGVVVELTSAIGLNARILQLVIGKTIACISMGLVANIVPLYLSETSPSSVRGFGINLYQNIQIMGIIICSGTVYGTSTLSNKGAYLIPIGLQLVAPILMVLVSPFLPESPRWLTWKGRHQEAAKAATNLFATPTNNFNAERYCKELDDAFEIERQNDSDTSWTDLLHGPDLRRTLIAVGVQSLQQAQGASYMTNYIVSFLTGLGITDPLPIIIAVFCTYWVAVVISHFLPDVYGRRAMLMQSSAMCAITMFVTVILTVVVKDPGPPIQKASIFLVFLWWFFFGLQGPVVWIITTESAPTRNREKVLGTATFMGFGISLLISSVSPYIQEPEHGNLGSRIGFIWAAFSAATVIWGFFFVPEMKGLSLEQLDYLFAQNVPTRQFQSYIIPEGALSGSGGPMKVDEEKVSLGPRVSKDETLNGMGKYKGVENIE